jgi:hypothetical protein
MPPHNRKERIVGCRGSRPSRETSRATIPEARVERIAGQALRLSESSMYQAAPTCDRGHGWRVCGAHARRLTGDA